MAKPLSSHRPASSTRILYSSASRRRRKVSFPVPSSAVLGILATIVSSVDASPAPPSFLCPSLIPQATPTLDIQPRSTRPQNPRRNNLFKRDNDDTVLPDRFEPDDTGVWRRVDTYTLYGSTVCLSCDDSTSSTASPTAFDDQIQDPATSSVSLTTASAPSSTYTISLPPGWKPPASSSKSRTALILVLSLVLALLICALIISCTFWRKNKRRKKVQNDVEMKARKQRKLSVDGSDVASILAEKEVKIKQKIWARATARWKANAKYSARLRRGKRIAPNTRMSSPRSSCTSLDRTDEALTSPMPIPNPSSPARPSRRTSLDSVYTATGSSSVSESSAPHPSSTLDHQMEDSSEVSPPPASPPAYDRSSIHASLSSKASSHLFFESNSLHLEVGSSNIPGSSNAPYVVHAAHVATDDKALLARMAELTSAPLDPAHSTLPNTADYHISVPVWQDEELEDFDHQAHEPAHYPSQPPLSSHRLFPLPPSKGKMSAPAFYDYTYAFDHDDILVEPEPGPSAPPFEEEPSNPFDVVGLAPSAPPLAENEPAYNGDTYPSAPPPE